MRRVRPSDASCQCREIDVDDSGLARSRPGAGPDIIISLLSVHAQQKLPSTPSSIALINA